MWRSWWLYGFDLVLVHKLLEHWLVLLLGEDRISRLDFVLRKSKVYCGCGGVSILESSVTRWRSSCPGESAAFASAKLQRNQSM